VESARIFNIGDLLRKTGIVSRVAPENLQIPRRIIPTLNSELDLTVNSSKTKGKSKTIGPSPLRKGIITN
jgi:hypothetical protein